MSPSPPPDRSAFGTSASVWRWVSTASNWRSVCASSITQGLDLSPVEVPVSVRLDAFEREGYAAAALLGEEETRAVRTAIVATVDAGLPGVFSYVYDALWTPLRSLLGHLRRRVGPCAALEDGWAWHIAPGGGGWSGHRGFPEPREDVPPQVINTWLAASNVTRRHSTIVVVPRSRDPHFPDDLDQAPDESAGEVLTARPGDVLYWDARIYHWGSQSQPNADGPRISASYTIATDDYDPSDPRVPLELPGLDYRLGLIARWIGIYGHLDPTITPAITEWAELWSGAQHVGG
jgi:hypothetical protein